MKTELRWKVKSVEPQEDYFLYVTFADGKQGLFDMKPYLDEGVFRELRDPMKFNAVRVCASSIAWDNEIDIAPETLYADCVSI
ncbi:MAG: DUF2442 domain-containing protein [Tannerella sp.]|jgi:hypothetical protein|nr:DUF2442 domain-containing protein [Tannerella sp.]